MFDSNVAHLSKLTMRRDMEIKSGTNSGNKGLLTNKAAKVVRTVASTNASSLIPPSTSSIVNKQQQQSKNIAASEEYNYALSQKSIKPWSNRGFRDEDGGGGGGGGDEYDEYREDDDDDDDDDDQYDYEDDDATEIAAVNRDKSKEFGKKCACSSANMSKVFNRIFYRINKI